MNKEETLEKTKHYNEYLKENTTVLIRLIELDRRYKLAQLNDNDTKYVELLEGLKDMLTQLEGCYDLDLLEKCADALDVLNISVRKL
jgi:hypothetical protein